MGLSDIFGNKGERPVRSSQSITGPPVIDAVRPPQTVADAAYAAANAYDAMTSAEGRYKLRREALLKQVEDQLAGLKETTEAASVVYSNACNELQQAMEAAGVTKVPMPDRNPIEIKIKKGGKKSITLKWLKKILGIDDAQDLWGKVPTHPDKRELVISGPFDDQPSD